MSQIEVHYRYPGIRSFEREEQELFFGRSEEIRNLYAQVKVMDLVVLFAKSGIGKSSLLSAGLVPLLELEPYVPVKVRFQDLSIAPLEALKQALTPYFTPDELTQHGGTTPEDAGFWEYLRSCTFSRYGEPATPFFIMDQFEEFFEHTAEAQKAFILDLADIVSHRLPNRVRNHLLSIPIADRTKADMAWHQPMQAKFIMAIRSDRLSLLDNLSSEIPLILNNRFHLRPLQQEKARDAIVEPAALLGRNFSTPAFSYAEETLKLILNELTNKNQEIESFQLQLVCQYIERLVQRHSESSNAKTFKIDRTFIHDPESIQKILNDYYESTIDTLPEQDREPARNFIETGLIVAGRRVGVTEGVEQERFGIGPELLKALIDRRLVRVENTHLGRSYEVSHDTMVPAILKSYEIRRKRLEQEAAEAARVERERQIAEEMEKRSQADRLEQERKLRLRTRSFAWVASILFLLALFGMGVAWKQNTEANLALNKALQAEEDRRIAEEAQKETELELLKTKAEIYLAASQPVLALREIGKARKIDSTANWIPEKMEAANLINSKFENSSQ